MTDDPVRPTAHRDAGPTTTAAIHDLLDQAVAAINRGDRVAGTALAEQVIAAGGLNAEAENLLAAPADHGEIRRMTIVFTDLVDSTGLSARVEPETYRMLVRRYRERVRWTVNRLEGFVGSQQGDGLLAVFGHPRAHEDDARRAVLAGLEITRQVACLNEQAQRLFGVGVSVRVGIHRGLVYLDTATGDVYGLAVNVAARVSGLAPPGSVVLSSAVEPLVRARFELQARPAAAVKGVDGLIGHLLVIDERVEPARLGHGLLVGRDREVAHLRKSWAHAKAGTLATPGVVFRGEPGIGKSRLAVAAAELVEDCGAVVLELAGSPFHTDTGLYPVRTLIERRCGISRTTDPGDRLRLLDAEVRACSLDPETTVPLLAPVLGIGAGYRPVAAEGRKLYELIAEAVRRYLLACLGCGAALMVAEDVHWFDSSTLEVLVSLLGAGEGRLLVVLTGRRGGWLPSGLPVTVFDLQALSDEQTYALIATLNPVLPADDRAAIASRCDGVPFYIEQLVAGTGQTGVPETLYEPLFARLRATANVVPVLEAAAVIGRHVDRGLLCAAIDLSDEEVDDVIGELEHSLVLEPTGTDNWRFRHELLREVAAELAPPSVRAALHARVADALVGGAGGDPDWRLVGVHYEQAERFDEAASAYRQAASDARRRGALAEARDLLTQALAQLDRAAPSRDRDRHEMAARLERGFLTMAADGQQSRESVADFERCLQLGGTDLRGDEVFATLIALTGYYATLADLRRLAQVLELLRASLRAGRHWFRPVIDIESGVLAWLRGEFDTARSHFEQATADLAAADCERIDAVWFVPSDAIATAYLHLAWARMVQGDLIGAEAALAKAARRADELGFPHGAYMHGYTLFMESWVRIEAGQLDRAASLVADMLGQAERHGFGVWQLAATTLRTGVRTLAAVSSDQGASGLAADIANLTAHLDTLRSLDVNAYITFHDAVLGRALIATGQPAQARARLDTALALAEDTGMHFYDAELFRLRAHTQSGADARHADISAALELARRQGATLFELRAALDDFELRGDSARAALADVVSRFPVDSRLPELARAEAALD